MYIQSSWSRWNIEFSAIFPFKFWFWKWHVFPIFYLLQDDYLYIYIYEWCGEPNNKPTICGWCVQLIKMAIPGSSKKQPSHEVPHHRGHVPPFPQFNVVFWILCLAASKKTAVSVDDARHFRSQHWSWVAGVSKVSLWFPVDGCFFWRTRY